MQLNNLNSSQTSNSWICPCNGCKKARTQALKEVLEILDGGGDAYSRIDLVRKLIEKK